jgi:hypothetical protein
MSPEEEACDVNRINCVRRPGDDPSDRPRITPQTFTWITYNGWSTSGYIITMLEPMYIDQANSTYCILALTRFVKVEAVNCVPTNDIGGGDGFII